MQISIEYETQESETGYANLYKLHLCTILMQIYANSYEPETFMCR